MTDLRKFRIRLAIVICVCAVVVSGTWIAIVTSDQKEQLKAQGKDFNEGFAVVKPENGKDGESAYEIAKRRGFSGTEEEWLASLISKPEDGLNAYQIAVIHGYTGSQTEWLASLKGAQGEIGLKGDQGLPGANGANGADGIPGAKGKDGQDGVNGMNGKDGRTPEYTCRDNTTMWRYTDEDETAWRPWFTVISCSQPPDEIKE